MYRYGILRQWPKWNLLRIGWICEFSASLCTLRQISHINFKIRISFMLKRNGSEKWGMSSTQKLWEHIGGNSHIFLCLWSQWYNLQYLNWSLTCVCPDVAESRKSAPTSRTLGWFRIFLGKENDSIHNNSVSRDIKTQWNRISTGMVKVIFWGLAFTSKIEFWSKSDCYSLLHRRFQLCSGWIQNI
jgi:hypothetical protein